MTFRCWATLVFSLAAFHFCVGQDPTPVSWHFEIANTKQEAATLRMSATLPPGWHLYSQFLKEDGPLPTQFRFDAGDEYILAGNTRERGRAVKFYDPLYGMEITWYSHRVIFEQDIKLLVPSTVIRGVIEFMVCNEEMCIPGEQEFEIKVGGH